MCVISSAQGMQKRCMTWTSKLAVPSCWQPTSTVECNTMHNMPDVTRLSKVLTRLAVCRLGDHWHAASLSML